MDEKKKAFIQEQLVPERNHKIKKGLLLVSAVIGCAVLFGLVAGFTMSAAQPYFKEWKEKNDGSAVSLEDEKDGEEQGEATEDGENVKEAEKAEEEKPETIIIEKEVSLDSIEETYTLLKKMAKKYNACIVTVSKVVQGVDWFDNPSELEEAAFGVILAEDSERVYILTSYDRIEAVESIQITFVNGETAQARVRGKDKAMNLAVISATKEQLSEDTKKALLVAELGDSYSLTEGSFVMALGSPNGYLYSMDFGMISGQKREQAVLDGKLELFHTTMDYHSEGEGIVINGDGRIIGLLTHAYDKENNGEINTMIGISRLKTAIEKMINKQPLSHFGIIASDIPDEKKEGLGVENGIYVTEAESNSPALEAGIRAGDVIVEVEGTRVSSLINFSNILAQYEPKTEIQVKFVRSSSGSSEEQEISVVLGKK